MDNLIKAFQILRKYGNPDWPTHCEHDVMYIDIDYNLVSDEDKEELDRLGIIEDSENEKFMSFRYGYCKRLWPNLDVVSPSDYQMSYSKGRLDD